MTRINVIPPSELTRQHLVAEYRELPRLFALIRAAHARREPVGSPHIPQEYRLGPGHVRFFYDKAVFLLRRYSSLVDEMRARGYNPSFEAQPGLIEGLPPERLKDWLPDRKSQALNRARIQERLAA